MSLRAAALALSFAATLPGSLAQQPAPVTAHAQADPLAQGGAAFEPRLPPALEVVRAQTGHLLVRPTLNGRPAGWFIFDTGAGICCVSTPHVAAFELAPAGDIASIGIGGNEESKLYRAATLALGPLTLSDHPVMATDLSFLAEHLGEEIAGVIGYGVLSTCVAEMDFVVGRVALHDPAKFELARGAWTPLELADRIPAVRARYEEREGLFHLDTGANNAVTFQEPAVRKLKLLEGREVSDAKLGGVGGFIAAKKGIVEWFEFGGVRQERITATFPLEAKGTHAKAGCDGTIGAELLRPFVLFTDYTHKRIAFVPRETAPPVQAR